jgi:hypothetical protein
MGLNPLLFEFLVGRRVPGEPQKLLPLQATELTAFILSSMLPHTALPLAIPSDPLNWVIR